MVHGFSIFTPGGSVVWHSCKDTVGLLYFRQVGGCLSLSNGAHVDFTRLRDVVGDISFARCMFQRLSLNGRVTALGCT